MNISNICMFVSFSDTLLYRHPSLKTDTRIIWTARPPRVDRSEDVIATLPNLKRRLRICRFSSARNRRHGKNFFSICWDFFIWQQKAHSLACRVSCRDWRNGGNEWKIPEVTKGKKEAKKYSTANRSAKHGWTRKIWRKVRARSHEFDFTLTATAAVPARVHIDALLSFISNQLK